MECLFREDEKKVERGNLTRGVFCIVFGAKMGMVMLCGKQYIDIEAVRCSGLAGLGIDLGSIWRRDGVR